MNNVVPLLVAIPLGVGFLIPLAGRWSARLTEVLSPITFLITSFMSCWLVGSETTYHMGAWPTPIGIDLRVDALTTLMLLIINGVALLVSMYSISYMQRYTSQDRYYSLLMFLVAGTNGVALSGDLFNLYVFIEITAIASYGLVAFCGEDESFEASFKYAVLGGLSSSVVLFAIILVYALTGALNLDQIASRFADGGMPSPLQFAIAMFFCGLGLKAALVPFHTWLPDAYPAAPAPISAILAGVVSKVIGVYVLARLLFNVFGITEEMLLLMRWMGGTTMVVGGLLALGQRDIKRLFAYSSVSQVGLIVLSLGFGSTWGTVGALFHLVNHAAFKPLLFFVSGQVESLTGTRDLSRMQGLGRAAPVTAMTSLVGSLSLAGIPPFNGFWSKLIIVMAGIQASHLGWAITVVVISIVALVYQLKVQNGVFYSPSNPPSAEGSSQAAARQPCRETSWATIPMIILAVCCVALSCLAWSSLEHPYLIGPAADVLMKGVPVP